MSILKAFFEIGTEEKLFEGLEISRETALCERYLGKFPVISISLKSVSGTDFSSACSIMRSVIGNEAMRFQFLLEDDNLTEKEKAQYQQLTDVDMSGSESFVMSDATLKGSLKTLSVLLHKHYGERVIILIDEYDVPLAKANSNGYYDQMVDLIRSVFDQVLKTNSSLYFAAQTPGQNSKCQIIICFQR